MLGRQIGLTQIYNALHNSSEQDSDIVEFRNLHRELDVRTAHAYGWDDIDLGHEFHEVPYLPENDRVRFTISESARIEVLRRLTELNRRRYEQEAKEGLHKEAKKPAASKKRADQEAGDLFISDAAETEIVDD